jgi:ankyrin repeat protein
MTTRMTAQRLGRLIAAGDVAAVRTAVTDQPLLLERTVERDGQNGWTPLHVAVAENQPEVVDLLIDAGADLSARTEHARTPLHVALEQAPDLVARRRKHGAVVDAPSAAFLDDVEQLTPELDAGAPLDDPVTGVDLLSWAAHGGATNTARLLLERGGDAGRGALRAAAADGRLELVQLLLAADVNATTNDGASALDMSRVAAARSRRGDAGRATGNDALADLLVAHGATD